MILEIEITSNEVPEYKRNIQIDSQNTFYDLHTIIQLSSGFDQSQMASFFINVGRSNKLIEISSVDLGMPSNKNLSMQQTILETLFEKPGQKITYHFDLINERFFNVEFKKKLMKNDLKEPFISFEKGKSPAQIIVSEIENSEVDLLELDDLQTSFAELEDYYEIYGEMES